MNKRNKMNWIGIADSLPNQNQEILCFEASYGMYVAKYSRENTCYDPGYKDVWNSGHCCGREPPDPTHWMPLPGSPSKEEKETD